MPDSAAYQHILLWRHADALPISNAIHADMERPLSVLGKKQARQIAAWLMDVLPQETIILSSPAKRTIETAQTLNRDIAIQSLLAPGAYLPDIIDAILQVSTHHLQAPNLLIVGHQPWIGQLAHFLTRYPLSQPAQASNAHDQSFHKSEVLWFRKPLAETSSLFEAYQSKRPDV